MRHHHHPLRAVTSFTLPGVRSAQAGRIRGRARGEPEAEVEVEAKKREPAFVRECIAGWHVYNGKGEMCFTFSKSYDACRLHGRLLVLCKKFPGGVDVVEYCWNPEASTFVEHRRYTDEAPFFDDVA